MYQLVSPDFDQCHTWKTLQWKLYCNKYIGTKITILHPVCVDVFYITTQTGATLVFFGTGTSVLISHYICIVFELGSMQSAATGKNNIWRGGGTLVFQIEFRQNVLLMTKLKPDTTRICSQERDFVQVDFKKYKNLCR